MGRPRRKESEGVAEGQPAWSLLAPGPTLAEASIELDAETEGINTWAESALHASLKTYFARPGDRLEVSLGGRIVDLLRSNGECVEIQTKRLDKIAVKVLDLARQAKVRVVHPVVARCTIVRLDPESGEVISERRSPRHGDFWTVFDELVMAPTLIAARNVTVEVLLVHTRELRTRDAKWSWRKKGDRVLTRELVEIVESRSLKGRAAWLRLLPPGLEMPCDSSSLGASLGLGAERARKVLYSLAKAGLLNEAGRRGRRKLFDRASS